jgi:hypothetical protein|eukprot:7360642-Prymnesium_polylepis.4
MLPYFAFATIRRSCSWPLLPQTEERHDETLRTFPDWVNDYAAAAELPALPDPGMHIYFTNFFVSRVQWWFRAEVQQYLRAVDASSGIYTHRWGDAPVQTVALELFASESTVSRLPTDYLHVSTMNRILVDGTEIDGWFDTEMQHHPIVHAHRRLQTTNSTAQNATNCTHLNGSVGRAGCAEGTTDDTRHTTLLSLSTTLQWDSLTPEKLAAMATEFATFFSVDSSAIGIHIAKLNVQVSKRVVGGSGSLGAAVCSG